MVTPAELAGGIDFRGVQESRSATVIELCFKTQAACHQRQALKISGVDTVIQLNLLAQSDTVAYWLLQSKLRCTVLAWP